VARFGDHGVGGKVPRTDCRAAEPTTERTGRRGAPVYCAGPAPIGHYSPVAAPDAVGVVPAIVLGSQPKTEDGQLFQSRCGPHRSCLCFDASENICRNRVRENVA